MTPHQTIAVAVRLFAIWLIVYIARALVSFYVESQGHSDPYGWAVALSFSGLAAVLVAVLWIFPQTVARRLLTSSPATPSPPSPPDLWLSMGCALIGLWVLTSAVPALVRDAVIVYAARDLAEDTTSMQHWMLYYCLEILIALWLIFGARGFQRVFWWARYAGLPRH